MITKKICVKLLLNPLASTKKGFKFLLFLFIRKIRGSSKMTKNLLSFNDFNPVALSSFELLPNVYNNSKKTWFLFCAFRNSYCIEIYLIS